MFVFTVGKFENCFIGVRRATFTIFTGSLRKINCFFIFGTHMVIKYNNMAVGMYYSITVCFTKLVLTLYS